MKRGGKLPAIPHSASKREKPENDTRKLRCHNCPKFFAQKVRHQRFCSSRCRDQFNNNRSGFGKLKERIPKFISTEVKRVMVEMIFDEVARASKEHIEAALADVRNRITKMERSIDFVMYTVERAKSPGASLWLR